MSQGVVFSRAADSDVWKYVDAVVNTVRQPLLILDSSLHIQAANHYFCDTFKLSADQVEGRLLQTLGKGQWDIPALREAVEKVLSKVSVIENVEISQLYPQGGTRTMLLNARRILEGTGELLICLAIEDITERKKTEEKLQEYYRKVNHVLESITDAFISFDTEWRFTYLNKQAERFKPEPGMDLIGKSVFEIYPQFRRSIFYKYYQQAIKTKKMVRFVAFNQDLKSWFEVSAYPSKNGLAVYLSDVSERVQREQQQEFLSQATELLNSSLDYEVTLKNVANLAVPKIADWCVVDMITESEGVENLAVAHKDKRKIALVHEMRRRYPPMREKGGVADLIKSGNSIILSKIPEEMLIEGAQDEEHLEMLRGLGLVSLMTVPLKLQNKVIGMITFVSTNPDHEYGDDDLVMAEELARRAAMAIDNAQLYHAAQEEIKERKQAEATIRHQAFHDVLTGLPNRFLLSDRLTVAINHAKRTKELVAVMFMDLDNFKDVNDSLSHQAGDILLKEVGKRIVSCIYEEDTVARFGGDEFLIMITGIKKQEEVTKIADRLIKTLEPAFSIEGQELHINASIGISFYPQDGQTPDELIKNADAALYQAKESGRNAYRLYNPDLNVKASHRLNLEHSLRRALKNEEFQVYYQPIMDANDSKAFCAEALIRWQHPEFGLVSPGDFIPLAEDTGFIVPLTNWILESICNDLKQWKRKYQRAPLVSMNLSARHFSNGTLLDDVSRILREKKVDPKQLKFEITESIAMQDTGVNIPKIKRLRELGVQIALDDFGTGHSSLSYLRKFDIDEVKIDKSFVQNCTGDERDASIIKAIISMAHTLGLIVVAEGVEIKDQYTFLCREGCDKIQGYVVSKPMPEHSYAEWIRDRVCDVKRRELAA